MLVRDAAERDIPEVLIGYQDDPQLHRRMGRQRPPSGAELGRASEQETALRSAGGGATLTILEPGSDVCRGQIHVHNVNWEHGRAELAIWLAPQVRGRGMAAGALRLTARWLIESCDLDRVQIATEADNEAMIRTARAAGFSHEGVLRGYTREGGTRVDNAMLSIVKADLDA